VRDPESEEIVGWVDARELFVSSASGPIGPHVKKPFFVSEFDRADRMLQLFRQKTIRLAVVVDERGETMGVATLSDVVAEIFGEIGDEDLPAEEPIREVGEASYILAGDVSVRDWRNLVRIAESIPQTATVGGLVTALLGRTARVGDEVELGNLHMEVLGMHGRRISEIRLTLPPEDASETQSEANAEGERP
jgi:CBS domain containing-hemolysin-like protein